MAGGIRKFILLGIGLSLVLPPSARAAGLSAAAAMYLALNNPRTDMAYDADPKNAGKAIAKFSPAPALPEVIPGDRTAAGAKAQQDLQTFVDANRKNLAEATAARSDAAKARERMQTELDKLNTQYAAEAEEMIPDLKARRIELTKLLADGGDQAKIEEELARREGVFKDNIIKGTGMQAEAQRSMQATGGGQGGGSGGGSGGGGGGKGGGGAVLALVAGAAIAGGAVAAALAMSESNSHDDNASKNQEVQDAEGLAYDEQARRLRNQQLQAQLIPKDQMKRAADAELWQQLLLAQKQAESKGFPDLKIPTPVMDGNTQGGVAVAAANTPAPVETPPRPTNSLNIGVPRTATPAGGASSNRVVASRQVGAGAEDEDADVCRIPATTGPQCYDRRGKSVSCRSRKAVRLVRATRRGAAVSKPGSCQPSGSLSSLHR